MVLTAEQRRENQRLNLQRWRKRNHEYNNKLQLAHSTKYQRWKTISKNWLKGFPPDLFI